MPYIHPTMRAALAPVLDPLLRTMARTIGPLDAGDVTYIAYRLLLAAAPRGSRFVQRNAMMGALRAAIDEYRRQVHEPAEDAARMQNGDIA